MSKEDGSHMGHQDQDGKNNLYSSVMFFQERRSCFSLIFLIIEVPWRHLEGGLG
jgi:hypothetical protein